MSEKASERLRRIADDYIGVAETQRAALAGLVVEIEALEVENAQLRKRPDHDFEGLDVEDPTPPHLRSDADFKPHPSHKMTQWESDVVALVPSTPRFGRRRECTGCGAEEVRAVSGEAHDGDLERECSDG